ncbi:MAG: DUF1365 domain-containing protein [Pseudomonadota bacterium]
MPDQTKTPPALRLLKGHTIHQRSVPFHHRFKYALNLIDIDIDRLDEAAAQSGVFSVDRSNLFSFNRRDHGARKDIELRPWAEAQFATGGIQLRGGVIRLISFPRHLFYKFAPISIWMGYGPGGDLRGVLYEVNNTFGETHTYVAATPEPGRNQHGTDKVFHVSPFFDVTGQYEFTLRTDNDRFNLIVATEHAEGRSHMATISARLRPATTAAFVRIALTKPFSSLAVTLAIHWQAFQLVLKGAKYHSKPKQSDTRITIAETKNADDAEASMRESAA